jgi:hypothetical protein
MVYKKKTKKRQIKRRETKKRKFRGGSEFDNMSDKKLLNVLDNLIQKSQHLATMIGYNTPEHVSRSYHEANSNIRNIEKIIISRKYFDKPGDIFSVLNNLLGKKLNNENLKKNYENCLKKCSDEYLDDESFKKNIDNCYEDFLKESLNLHDYEITYSTTDEDLIKTKIVDEKESFLKFNKEWKMLYYKDDHWVAVCRYPGDKHVYEYDQEAKMYDGYYSFFSSQYNVTNTNFYLVEKKSRFRKYLPI